MGGVESSYWGADLRAGTACVRASEECLDAGMLIWVHGRQRETLDEMECCGGEARSRASEGDDFTSQHMRWAKVAKSGDHA